ncbi:MAG: NAD-dependent epimerase/dehydratase family protein [Candidatus Omnitrophica bacterium]|nr:NAD-dependent epimerase/dehydratase family protein [Candidatus Omnitrophota bacterium]
MPVRKILVTGGAGFIGSHVVESLVRAGWEVTVYDDLSSGRREYLKQVAHHVRMVEGDVLDTSRLRRVLRGHEIVSHQAAQLEIFRALEEPQFDLKTNTLGTLSVLEAARAAGVKRVVNASSACVYGQAKTLPQAESHPQEPNWPYGVSKLAAEHYVRLYQTLYGVETVSLRYGIVYGPREWLGRVLTCFLKRALEGKPPVIFGDGRQVRDFVFVDDVVRFHNLLLEQNSWSHSCYNVGTGVGTEVRALAEMVSRVTGAEAEPIYEDAAEGESSRHMPERKRIPYELKAMVLGVGQARALGWEPAVSLEEGIQKEWEWMKENRSLWRVSRSIAV